MESRPVRLGWLSLLLTVIILCLATLSVLSFSTARADLALAQKQARQAQSVYALECAGQQWLAELDAALAQAGDTAELDALLPHGTAREGPGVSAVLEGADGYLMVRPEQLVYPLIAAEQQLGREVESLKKMLDRERKLR